MLTKREKDILSYFLNHPDTYISSKKIAANLNVSSRTIKSDLNAIKEHCSQYSFFELTSKKSKGFILNVKNKNEFENYVRSLKRKSIDTQIDEQHIRVKKLVLYLLSYNKPASRYSLLDHFFISESTLYNMTKLAEKLVAKYELELIYERGKGYSIEGTEQNKRKCILNEHLFKVVSKNLDTVSHITHSTNLAEIVSSILSKHNYSISDFFLQNLLMHISLMLERIEERQIIREFNDTLNIKETVEYQIAKEIIKSSISDSMLNDFNLEYEIMYLTTNLISKNELKNNSLISKEIYNFIDDAFEQIKIKFAIDLTNEEDFKNSIVLHVAPLLTRIKLDMQLKSKLSKEIKQSFPVATNVASYLSQLIYDKFELKVSDDEVSYLASYINFGLQHYSVLDSRKSVLLISSLRNSETMLLKDKILTWFKYQVADVTIVDPQKIDVNLTEYDAILTTENELSKYKGSAVKVSVFPNDHDFLKINLAINGFDSMDSIVSKFSTDLTFQGKVRSKEEMIDILCDLAEEKLELNGDLRESIYAREERGDTYFGNFIAMPHPLTPTTDKTFVVLGLLDKPIKWGDEESVRIVLMVSVEKNNPKSFQLWHYLSSLVTNQELIYDLLDNLNYENFINKLEQSLEEVFS